MTDLSLIRLVDDDPALRTALSQALRIAGFNVEAFDGAEAALAGLDDSYPGVVLSDVRMPGTDGLELHRRLHAMDPELPVILLTGHGDVAMAVAAIRAGAWDFLTKPVGTDALVAALRRALLARGLVLENRYLRHLPRAVAEPGVLLGTSAAITQLREAAQRLGEASADVLITGPSGAGKKAMARAIHAAGPRRGRAFVHVACDSLDEARFDLEFLGAEAGHAGTPRHARTIGRFEQAHRGILLLHNVDLLPLSLQARIAHVIEARSFYALGATVARPLDLQILAITRADLAAAMAEGRFRADLYYRLSGVSLSMPPLAERRDDIPALFRHFLIAACGRLGVSVPALTPAVQARLSAHNWPGNARELEQFAAAQALGLPALPAGLMDAAADMNLPALVAQYEAGILRAVLQATAGNATLAMTRLGLARKTFYDKLNRHGIRPDQFRADSSETGS
ncbi:sigma-54-dependent transcriptional regulator [Ketogulonicigenium vulgare]|uniref:sigma-54-dependent transcriptional regulator n=1 Tax=Ketogulonicigenium vulgare TaxID=92945 RepID=UPI0023584B0F|nr:sigma-54 dependent transcriptional regulator [Ketogulonicigenium vulgare]